MRLETQFVGSQKYPLELAHLIQGDGEIVASGVGKGIGLEAVAGAYYEALERYYISAPTNSRHFPGEAALKKAKDVARQPALANDLAIQRWAAEFPESITGCTTYGNARSSAWYPIFMCDPLYHHKPLPGDNIETFRSMLRYTSSLGTASGATPQEARLHGICELIEHDAISHALLRWFIARMPQIDILDTANITDRIRLLHDIATETAGGEVFLLDVTTDLGIPAYLAVSVCGMESGLLGAGASLTGEHAVARALNELIQVMVLGNGVVTSAARARLATWPFLQRCLTLPLATLNTRDVKQVPLRPAIGNVKTLESSLDTITSILSQHDIHSYDRELAPPNSAISVISTIAPGLERFSLVRMGIPVIPTGRGWGVWATYRSRR
jgi:ribosomal protein S12 methylthiotransferase accessory factor